MKFFLSSPLLKCCKSSACSRLAFAFTLILANSYNKVWINIQVSKNTNHDKETILCTNIEPPHILLYPRYLKSLLTWLNSCRMFLCRASVWDRTSEPAFDTQFCMCLLTSLSCWSNLSISASLPSPWASTAVPSLRNDDSFTSSSLSSFLACHDAQIQNISSYPYAFTPVH